MVPAAVVVAQVVVRQGWRDATRLWVVRRRSVLQEEEVVRAAAVGSVEAVVRLAAAQSELW